MQRIMIRAKIHRATARMAQVGDLVIIMAFGVFDELELTEDFELRKVFVDAKNRMTEATGGW
jgi:aspartate 1-decarboxylase